MSSVKDSGDQLFKYRSITVVAGKMAPGRVMHLIAHAVALKLS